MRDSCEGQDLPFTHMTLSLFGNYLFIANEMGYFSAVVFKWQIRCRKKDECEKINEPWLLKNRGLLHFCQDTQVEK